MLVRPSCPPSWDYVLPPPFLALSLEAGLGPPCGEEEEAVSEGSGSQVEGVKEGEVTFHKLPKAGE